MSCTKFPTSWVMMGACFIIMTSSCGQQHHDEAPPLNPELSLWSDTAQQRQWMQRVSRKLRFGRELNADEWAWSGLSADAFIDRMFDDQDFGMAVLDFNMHALGMGSDFMKMPDTDFSTLFSLGLPKHYAAFTNAVSAAREAVANGDHLGRLVEIESSLIYLMPNGEGTFTFGKETIDLGEQRRQFLTTRDEVLKTLQETAIPGGQADDFCKAYYERFYSYRFSIDNLYTGTLLDWANDPLEQACIPTNRSTGDNDTPSALPPLPADIKERVAETARRQLVYKSEILSLEGKNYAPKTLKDLRYSDLSSIGKSNIATQNSGDWFWSSFPNSSTNMNRKRAAYVLKRFFCDDLTPINVEIPASHASDRHASDPACQSCHYKLDPIAGFFRERGQGGRRYSGPNAQIIFDDDAAADLQDYTKQWRRKDGSGWDIGYVRSSIDPSRNDYPSHGNPELKELTTIIRQAPEARRCLVENLFHYLVGEEVALDAGYHAELTAAYDKAAQQSTALALKETMRTVLKSYSFLASSTEKGVCYDYAANEEPSTKPPCEIAYIIKKNCESCHGATNDLGGLNLSKWTAAKEQHGFDHKRPDGKSLSFAESLARLEERLMTRDSDQRMPLRRYMDPSDREALYRWVKAEQARL